MQLNFVSFMSFCFWYMAL